jgi:hypothetical protein
MYICLANGICFTSMLPVGGPTDDLEIKHVPRIYILPPDDGLQMCPKHVEVG